jgi:hypothetical protein
VHDFQNYACSQGFVVTFVAHDLHQYVASELHAMICNECLVNIVSMLVGTCIETYIII